MKVQIRMNPKKRCVELKTSPETTLPNALQKSSDYIRAFMLGFEIRDAIALLRLDELYIDSFEIKDVKTLNGEHLSRAIGRIAGVGGKTKYVHRWRRSAARASEEGDVLFLCVSARLTIDVSLLFSFRFTIENSTKTRIVLADTHIHILGSYTNINIAKSAIVRLIMGSPPGKVYSQMTSVAQRMKERF